MNPFEQEEDIINPIINDVIISTESIGKRIVTYISGLPYDRETMKLHLSTLKKKHGCSGSLKDEKKIKDRKDNEKNITSNMMVGDDDNDNKNDKNNNIVLLFQGDQVDNLKIYFTNLGIIDIKISST